MQWKAKLLPLQKSIQKDNKYTAKKKKGGGHLITVKKWNIHIYALCYYLKKDVHIKTADSDILNGERFTYRKSTWKPLWNTWVYVLSYHRKELLIVIENANVPLKLVLINVLLLKYRNNQINYHLLYYSK